MSKEWAADADGAECFRSAVFLLSLEGREPPHVHVERGQCTAKFWLDPVQLAGSRGFRSHELNRVRALVIEHRAKFKEAWHAQFGA
jgi:Domain of unknown function (DUF4160)